ncbi:MAG: type I-A CRISPR-associated protein Cas4/Csa1 [Candidatus Brockarchaeota archaeon]|nr:type I-A CRISPR-associated protein Cas4/Csa1 [Candidatus Brockarchaeota archaeon]
MFFLNRIDLDKRFKILRADLQSLGISEELRGWNWQSPPIEPPSRSMFFGVGDLAARYCKTLRDIYLKKVENIKPPPNLKMFEGIVYHGVATDAVTKVKSLLFEKGLIGGADIVEELMPSVPNACERLTWDALNTVGRLEDKDIETVKKKARSFYRFLLVQAASQVNLILTKFPHIDVDSLVNQAIPPIVERKVDGSLVGLSKELSADVYTPAYAVADLKTGEVRDFHPYAPTGYALAIEADEETAVNFGMIIYVRLSTQRPVPTIHTKCFLIGDELRREFLEIRDEAFEIVANARDPGKPAVCPDYCPYYPVCTGQFK